MIGFFLVFVATVWAIGREWWNRMKDLVYGRRIQKMIAAWTAHNNRCIAFVQYFIRGKEYWYWKDMTEIVDPDDLRWLLTQKERRGPHKVTEATMHAAETTIGVDVTRFMRELSGPAMDFYGSVKNLEEDVLLTYLCLRFGKDGDLDLYTDLACHVYIVPGFMSEPFKFDLGSACALLGRS